MRFRQLAETPLHQAADYSQHALAALLLTHHADPNRQQSDGDTPLHHAVFRGDLKMVHLLLHHGADPNLRNFMFGRTPLHYAVDCSHLDCIRAILSSGGDVTILDKVRDRQYGKGVWDMAKTDEVKNVLQSLDSVGEMEGPTLATRGEYAADGEDSEHVSLGSRSSIARVLDAIVLQQTFEDSYKATHCQSGSLTDTVIEKQGSVLNSYQGSVASPTLPISVVPDTSAWPSVSEKHPNWTDFIPLQEWLERRNLGEVYELLAVAGYDDIEEMAIQMQSPLPITDAQLLRLGVKALGHRMRFLMRLEEEAGLFVIQNPSRVSTPAPAPKILQCCGTPNNASNFGVSMSRPLKEWLRRIKLEYLYPNFQRTGFDDLQDLTLLMSWKTPISDEILEREIGVSKPGHRSRILSRLKEEALGINRDSAQLGSRVIALEPEERIAACQTCGIM